MKTKIFLIVLVLLTCVYAQDDAVILANFPGLSLTNPAYSREGLDWQVDFFRPYAGIGDPLSTSTVSAKYGLSRLNIALTMEYFNSGMYHKTSLIPGLGYKFGDLSVGIGTKIVFDGWRMDNFHYLPGDNPYDSYFSRIDDGEKTAGFTLNTGALWHHTFAEFGLLVENLFPVALSPDETEIKAVQPHVDLSVSRYILQGKCNVALGYDKSAPEGYKVNFGIGYSRQLTDKFSAATSFDFSYALFDLGFAYRISPNLTAGYAFEFPCTWISSRATSHRFSLTGNIPPQGLAKKREVEEDIDLPDEDQTEVEKEFEEKGVFVTNEIHFEFDSDQISNVSHPLLDKIGDAIVQHPEWEIEIAGHTDSIGVEIYNLDLSQRRAQSVKAYLVEHFDIPDEKLSWVGYGETKPVADNGTKEGRALNRRVEFIIKNRE